MLFVEQYYSVHSEKVNCMCRICDERVKRQIKDKLTPLKLCETYVKELSIYPGLDTTHDKEDEHPKGMCTKSVLPKTYVMQTCQQFCKE